MHLYRDIQKWMYNSWSAFSNPFSDYPNTLTSSTTDISPNQRIWTSGVKSASRLTLSSMTAVEATVVTPTKDQKNYSFVLMNAGDFDCLNPSSCFDTSGKRWFQSTHDEHRNFWSRIFLSRTYLFVNHKLNAEKIMLRDCLPFGHDYCPEIGFFLASRSGNPNPDISLPSPKCCGFRAGLRARWLSREDHKVSCHSRLVPPWV